MSGFDSRFPPTPARRLRERAEQAIGGETPLRGAFVAYSGAGPVVDAWTQIPLIGELIGLVVAIANVNKRNRYHTIAVTDDEVLLIRNRFMTRPHALVARRPRRSLSPLQGSGDEYVFVDDVKYWVPMFWTDEARRIS